MTRFEDRFKQPLGISVNFTSYAARLLTQARSLLPIRFRKSASGRVSSTSVTHGPNAKLGISLNPAEVL